MLEEKVAKIIKKEIRGIYHIHMVEITDGSKSIGYTTFPIRIGLNIDGAGILYRGSQVSDLDKSFEDLVKTLSDLSLIR